MTTNTTGQTGNADLTQDQFLELAHQIATYREIKNPNGYSDQRVALDIADNMLIVARKHGIRAYTKKEIIKGKPSELQGPFSNDFQRCRTGIFDALAALPFITAKEVGGIICLKLRVPTISKADQMAGDKNDL